MVGTTCVKAAPERCDAREGSGSVSGSVSVVEGTPQVAACAVHDFTIAGDEVEKRY